MKDSLLLVISFFIIADLDGQLVVINEFMANNNVTIQDSYGDYSDWIELYNTSDSIINLVDYSLSDEVSDINKWVFPEIYILPHSYLLIFASGRNVKDVTELHTNFKISSSGEKLFLSNASDIIIDETISISLEDDESYCRVPDGSTPWIETFVSSPNTTNNYSNQLLFSKHEGFYTSPISLSVNSAINDTVYFTLNGDIPTEKSTVYVEPLLIEDRSSQPNILSEIPTSPKQDLLSYKAWEAPKEKIDKATVLRFASYRNGQRTSKIYTKTYFVGDEIADKYSLPVISLTTPMLNLFNAETGIMVPGVNYDSNNPEWTGNYFMRGEDWERDIHIEYFDENGSLGFSQDAGIRIHGGKTRQAAQKSLRLYARNEYGDKYFKYKLLPQRDVNKYERIVLCTTMGSWGRQTIFKDALAQNISSSLNTEYQEFQAVIVFINGEYWGIQTIKDRIDERFIEYVQDIDQDSVEFRGWGNSDYNDMIEFIEDHNLEDSDNYNYIKSQIDIENYIDYTIAELFLNNYDWPANNMKVWRKTIEGKWRWILYDLDAAFGHKDYDMLVHATEIDPSVIWPNPPVSTFLFRSFLKNKTFRSRFINRYSELLSSKFDPITMVNKLDSIKAIYSPELESHIGRWNFPDSYRDWEDDIEDNLLSFIVERPCIVRGQIMLFFELSDLEFDCSTMPINGSDSNLILAPNPNRGSFFLVNNIADISDATITITSIKGELVYKESSININKNERKYINLENLSRSCYVLQIKSANYSEEKLVVISD